MKSVHTIMYEATQYDAVKVFLSVELSEKIGDNSMWPI